MAGASSLQQDILALVNKHSDTCLPQDLLRRLAEEARLLAAREEIRYRASAILSMEPNHEMLPSKSFRLEDFLPRGSGLGRQNLTSNRLRVSTQHRSLHEEDRFGLFSELSSTEHDSVEEVDEEEDHEGNLRQRGVAGLGENAVVLPDNVKRMLGTMRVTRLDKVAALSGFTTIDAEVEFSESCEACATDCTPFPASPGVEQGGAEHTQQEDEEEAQQARPVFLTFRFRREPLTKTSPEDCCANAKCIPSPDAGILRVGSVAEPGVLAGGVETIDLDAEEDGQEIVALLKGRAPLKSPSGHSININNGVARWGIEGRKRSGSRGGEFDVRGGGEKGIKRPKAGRREQEEEADRDEGEEEGEGEGVGDNAEVGDDPDGSFDVIDGDEDAESGDGLDYDPKTLVSYTVCGGIGYDRPEVLLQAVVYARGDGPACVMPPLDDGEDPESVSGDQEDVFDCNVDGPALAAVGRALGLHHDPSESDSNGTAEEEGLDDLSEETGGPADGGMTLSDLVWWIMLFPFFEKEFDMVEVVASSVFGDDGSDSDDGEYGSEEQNEGEDSGEATIFHAGTGKREKD